MWQIVGFVLHVLVIYAAAQLVHLPGADLLRCAGAGCLSYLAMLALPAVTLLVADQPWVQNAVNVGLFGAATAAGARVVLACGWRPACVIGASAVAMSMLYGLLAGATPLLLPPGCGG